MLHKDRSGYSVENSLEGEVCGIIPVGRSLQQCNEMQW